MLKKIPKSDISIRPFKVYKDWSFSNTSNALTIYEANSGSSTLSNGFPKDSIYGQIRAMFYNGHEDNPFLRFGRKTNVYTTDLFLKERSLSEGQAKILSIPQIYIGEGIKPKSVELNDDGTEYIDDGYGNIVSPENRLFVTRVDLQAGIFNFDDNGGNVYSCSISSNFFNLQTGQITFTTNSVTYGTISNPIHIISYDSNTGQMVVDNLSLIPTAGASSRIGNVFYEQGLLILTKAVPSRLTSDWTLNYKSTETIYEHEYLLSVSPDEFNVSQNPSAFVEIGKETETFIDSDGIVHNVVTNPGVKYIRRKTTLDNGTILDYRYGSSISSVSGGFEHFELSSSVDRTGSFLTPFITTIGLYDDNAEMVAVAKLARPIKSEPDIPLNFIVRFDT